MLLLVLQCVLPLLSYGSSNFNQCENVIMSVKQAQSINYNENGAV